jgi:hypothetical protein
MSCQKSLPSPSAFAGVPVVGVYDGGMTRVRRPPPARARCSKESVLALHPLLLSGGVGSLAGSLLSRHVSREATAHLLYRPKWDQCKRSRSLTGHSKFDSAAGEFSSHVLCTNRSTQMSAYRAQNPGAFWCGNESAATYLHKVLFHRAIPLLVVEIHCSASECLSDFEYVSVQDRSVLELSWETDQGVLQKTHCIVNRNKNPRL